jgi:hypothetical protein
MERNNSEKPRLARSGQTQLKEIVISDCSKIEVLKKSANFVKNLKNWKTRF